MGECYCSNKACEPNFWLLCTVFCFVFSSQGSSSIHFNRLMAVAKLQIFQDAKKIKIKISSLSSRKTCTCTIASPTRQAISKKNKFQVVDFLPFCHAFVVVAKPHKKNKQTKTDVIECCNFNTHMWPLPNPKIHSPPLKKIGCRFSPPPQITLKF